MLDWLKRKPAPAPIEQMPEDEGQKPLTDERLERMLGRLGSDGKLSRESVAEASDTVEPPPSAGNEAAGEPALQALSEIDRPLETDSATVAEPVATPSEVASPGSAPDRADRTLLLRRAGHTTADREPGPSAAELLAKGYSFGTGPDGKMVIFDAEGNLTDVAFPLPSAVSRMAAEPAAERPSPVAPPPIPESAAAADPAAEAETKIAPSPSPESAAAADSAVEAETKVAPSPSPESAVAGDLAAEAETETRVAPSPSAESAAAGAPVVEAETKVAPLPRTRKRTADEPAATAPPNAITPPPSPNSAAADERAPDASRAIAAAPDISEPAAAALDAAPPARTRKRTARAPAAEPLQEITPPPTGGKAAGATAGGFSQMRVIAVASQKGGSGKTTIAAHLAVRADAVGQGPVVLIDTDPQGSLAEWWRARTEDTPQLASVRPEALAANLAELRSYGTALAVIDTPPALTGSIEQVIAMADLILIPVRPSPHDLRAAGGTVELARKAGKPFMFIVNSASPRASITAQAVAALSEHGRVAPVILYQRTEYAASMIDGRTVMETAAGGRSAQELAELWQCVYAQIGMRAAA
jgi:chromosome partitioning protein